MKSTYFFRSLFILTLLFSCLCAIVSCNQGNALESKKTGITKNTNDINRTVNKALKKYWFDGKAEISSYTLNQARYGEIHKGTATLIYVTEPFSKTSNTKADFESKTNIPVLKLNSTKKFNTGIYPYSLMNSTFFPFENENTSLKLSSSIQEWCGMVYMEMKHEDDLIFNLNSYFEGESFKDKRIKNTILEDDLWSLLRLNPDLLPKGEHAIIPSMFFLRLMHKDFKSYQAICSINSDEENSVNSFTITYPNLGRSLKINYSIKFPYKVLGWKETYVSGFGNQRKELSTEAKLITSLKIEYWNKNKNKDSHLRDSLGI